MNPRFSRKKHNRPERRFYRRSLLPLRVGKQLFAFFWLEIEAMCPECFAAVALLVSGIASTGGVAAVAAQLFHNNKPGESVSEVRIPEAKESSK